MTDTSKAIVFGAKTPDTIKPTTKRIEVRDLKYDGLRLVVQPSGKKSWAFRYRFGGDQWKLTYGKWPHVQVSNAHKRAAEDMEKLANGINPAHVPSHPAGDAALATKDTSLENMIKIYDKNHIATLRPGTQKYVRRELDQLKAALPGRDVKSITDDDILAITDAAQSRGPHAKNQTIKTLQAFFLWVVEDRKVIKDSPARGIRKVEVKARDRKLSEDEIKVLWAKATEVNGPYGALVKLLLLTGCRRNEIARLEWSEITEDAIYLSAERTKTGEAFIVPLTQAMRDVLATLPRKGKYVLGTGDARRPMSASNWAKQKLDGALVKPWRFHDLRRTFRSGLSKLKVPREVAEACLNHAPPPIIGVYDHHDYEPEKKEAFEKWSNKIIELTADNVVLDTASNVPIAEVVA